MDDENLWDVAVIGGGAAGLSAALMLGRARRRVVVLDAGLPRNRFADHVHGALGIEGVSPAELVRRGREECAAYGVVVEHGAAERIVDEGERLRVDTGEKSLRARAVVVATGQADDLPDVPGLRERWGRSVLHCPYCHGWEVRDRRLGLLLADEKAAHLATLLPQWSRDLTVFAPTLEQGARDRLAARGAEVVDSPVVAVRGPAGAIDAVVTADGIAHPIDALFVPARPVPHDGFLAGLDLARTETPFGSFLAVDPTGRTSAPRVWAVGNVVDPSANVPLSIGAGSRAGAMVNAFLAEEDAEAAVTGPPVTSPRDFWEERYAGSERVWSGRANASVVEALNGLSPGTALELGCGEGADALWLAGRGWDVTALDISATAIGRARDAAADAGLAARVRFERADLADGLPDGPFDLVAAAYLQSPVSLPRERILRRAVEIVAPGGHLLVVAHAAAPPWARQGHAHVFPTVADEVAALGLPAEGWQVIVAEVRSRGATAPDGTPAKLDDVVVLARREAE